MCLLIIGSLVRDSGLHMHRYLKILFQFCALYFLIAYDHQRRMISGNTKGQEKVVNGLLLNIEICNCPHKEYESVHWGILFSGILENKNILLLNPQAIHILVRRNKYYPSNADARQKLKAKV